MKTRTRGLVLGVGISAKGTYAPSYGGKPTREYTIWSSMLGRCYDKRVHAMAPTYAFCSVSDEFLHFQRFAEWCNSQAGYEGGELDKDLLVRGNSIYSEDRCTFLPNAINMLLIRSGASRGKFPIGASFRKAAGKFVAQMSLGNSKVKHLGYFDNPLEAHLAYKAAKEALIKQRAEEYRSVLDPRAYDALMRYEIRIDD